QAKRSLILKTLSSVGAEVNRGYCADPGAQRENCGPVSPCGYFGSTRPKASSVANSNSSSSLSPRSRILACNAEYITLPNHDGPSTCLFAWAIRTEVSPPKLPSLQRRS